MTLGNKIQEIRTARGMSQEQFAEVLGTTRQTVSKWELDQMVPDIRKIVALSRLFCVPTDDLLINVTTFENEGIRFGCGVYRSTTSEIIETETIAIEYYARGKHILGARLYEGNGDVKKLVSMCEKNCEDNSISYVYVYMDDKEKMRTVGNCDEYKKRIGEQFDRKQLDKMECLESFQANHGEYRLHTVSEIGIRQCLEEWRKGVKVSVSADNLFVNICTGRTEYVYHINVNNDNIYCGCSYNIPFELGLRNYGQFFRIRNCGDNSEPYCVSFYDFGYRMPKEADCYNYRMPKETDSYNYRMSKDADCYSYGISKETDGADCAKAGGRNENSQWFVKRYKDDEIVLDGCGDDEYIYRKNEAKYESFV